VRALTALITGLLLAAAAGFFLSIEPSRPLQPLPATGLAVLLGALGAGATFLIFRPTPIRNAPGVPDASDSPQRSESNGGSDVPRRMFLLPLAGGLAGWALVRLWPEASPNSADAGQRYYEASKLPEQAPGVAFTSGGQSPESLLNQQALALPAPSGAPDLPLAEAIARRRSVRNYGDRPLTLEEVSRLLFATQGLTRRVATKEDSLRAAPSAGALYPIEVYLAAFNVAGLAQGIHAFDPWLDQLTPINTISREDLVRAGLGQGAVRRAAAIVILTGVPARLHERYGDRTQRYMLLEAGHIGQNVYLSATALGLGACAIGAFVDDDLNGLLHINGRDQLSLYLLTVGPPAT
jgi:SagB-type dehydrogenase family enzyme